MSARTIRPLGRTGLHPGLIGFGAIEIGRDWGIGTEADRRRPGEEEAGKTLLEVLDLGVTLIDTASAYHRSEERIGTFLHDRRKEYVLATKCGEHSDEPRTYYDFSYSAIAASIDRSLNLLQTDVIDLLQIHFGPDPDAVLDDGGCVRAMREAQERGVVRFLGASAKGPILDRCIDDGTFDVLQMRCSLLDQAEEARIARAHARGIGVLIKSSLAGGWLTRRALTVSPQERPPGVNALLNLCGQDPNLLARLGLHYLASQAGVSCILVGSRSAANIRSALEQVEMPVDADLLARAREVVRLA